MTREEFNIYKAELIKRFYWCTSRSEFRYLTKEKGYKYLFRCTHYKTDKYFWVFDRTEELLGEVEEFYKRRREEKIKVKEGDVVTVG